MLLLYTVTLYIEERFCNNDSCYFPEKLQHIFLLLLLFTGTMPICVSSTDFISGSGSHGQLFLPYRAHQHGIADGRKICSLPFTAKTGAKHPIIKAPAAPQNTCGSCWLCLRHLTD